MADFEVAYNKTMAHEGGYTHDPNDAGGETYKGIARVYNGSWDGWDVIDSSKGEPDFPECLDAIYSLQTNVHEFYKENYWDVNRLDDFPSQAGVRSVLVPNGQPLSLDYARRCGQARSASGSGRAFLGRQK